MVPDGWTDGMDGRTDAAKTISLRLRRGIISVFQVTGLKILVRVCTHTFFLSFFLFWKIIYNFMHFEIYNFMHFERHFAFQIA